MSARKRPSVTKVRAATREALVLAAGERARVLSGGVHGERVLIVYGPDAARLYTDPPGQFRAKRRKAEVPL